jgi:TolB-like protein/DNA-binding SARP family transcriptional activator/lipoprotein NlpI
MYRLVTFGGLALFAEGQGESLRTVQRRPLALLALLAASGRQGLSREKLIGYLWPERESDKARNLLDQAVYAARRGISAEVFVTMPTALALDPDVLPSDVGEFDAAVAAGDHARAVACYTGPFLDGVYLSDASAFERWVDDERARLARLFTASLEALAAEATRAGDFETAAKCWRRVVDAEPLSARSATGYMLALAAHGDRTGALEFFRVYDALVRQEFDTPADPSVAGLAADLRESRVPAAAHPPAASVPVAPAAPTPVRSAPAAPGPGRGAPAGVAPQEPETPPGRGRRMRGLVLGAVAIPLLAVVAVALWMTRPTPIANRMPAAAGTDSIPSVAVVPFVNVSAQPDNEFFVDGITDELIATLAQLPTLHVSARTSAFSFKGRKATVREVGQALDVQYVIEGSVRRIGRHVLITAELVSVKDGFSKWSAQYDRQLGDIFAVQRDIARAITVSLSGRLGPARPDRVVPPPTQDVDAYLLYLQGRYAWHQRGPEPLQRAVQLFQAAIAKDPRFANAYAGLADAYVVWPVYYAVDPDPWYARADEAARHALSLDSTLAEPYASLGFAHMRQYRWEDATRELSHALALSPNYATAHQWYGKVLAARGQLADADRELRTALALDPLSAVTHYNLGQSLFWQRRYREAREQIRRALYVQPSFPQASTMLALIDIAEGHADSGLGRLRRVADDTRSLDDVAMLAYGFAAAGQHDAATRLLSDVRDGLRAGRHVSAADISLVYVALGRTDEAFAWLHRAWEAHDSDLQAFVQSPMLDPLRSDERFDRLMRDLGLRP